MDSGLAQSARPGMTERSYLTLATPTAGNDSMIAITATTDGAARRANHAIGRSSPARKNISVPV
jgi:hypothetical protein